MTPEAYVQQKAAASGSSFYYAFLFLPPPRRAAITAYYAFCREVDDVVDEVADPGVAASKLQWWRGEVDALFAGRPSHPVLQALQPHLRAFGLERLAGTPRGASATETFQRVLGIAARGADRVELPAAATQVLLNLSEAGRGGDARDNHAGVALAARLTWIHWRRARGRA